ncbi:MAG: isoprenyl transferase [Clostridia bacterium]|nr:isoprenyl transferase [Clostridia bacterium]
MFFETEVKMEFNQENMPKHIGIIMDGNRRWAKEKGKPVSYGHKEGAKTLEKIVRYANKIGLDYITVYAFSTENWKRAEEEVKSLMILLQNYLDDYAKRADTENIRVKILGDISLLSSGMQKSIQNCMERTKNNTGVTFNIALNYGGRDELIKATRKIAELAKNNEIQLEDISEETIQDNLYTKGQPDLDLLIRTSGEKRLSGFLPWQSTYAEILFIDKNWPDFEEKDLEEAIIEYQKRTRKFGAG